MSDLPVLMRAGGSTAILLPSYVTVAEFRAIMHSAPSDERAIVEAATDEEVRFWLTSTRFHIDAFEFKGFRTDPFPGYVDEQGNPIAQDQLPAHLVEHTAFPRMELYVYGQLIDSMTVPGGVQQAHARYTGWAMTNPNLIGAADHPSTLSMTQHIENFKAGQVAFGFKDSTEVETWHDLPIRHSDSLILLNPYLLNPDIVQPAQDTTGPGRSTRSFAPGAGNRAYGLNRRW